MFGAIIGDLAGSIYEYEEFQDSLKKKKNIERRKEASARTNFITADSFISDDTILTVAIADAILHKRRYADAIKEYGKKYAKVEHMNRPYFKEMFSPGFIKWLKQEEVGYSFGNGASMRVSPIGYWFDTIDQVQNEAEKSAIPSHSSEEGIKGAKAIATVIFMARQKKKKEEIKNYVEETFHYQLDWDLEKLAENNVFDGTAKTTVPQAISIFLQANNFEEGIKKAVGIGGDTDTIACMTGSMLEAYYEIPLDLKKAAFQKIPKEFQKIVLEFYEKKKNITKKEREER